MTNQVDYQRPEVTKHVPDWDKVDDVVAGERTVKEKKTVYLPKPNPNDGSPENATRYTQYVERAVFFNPTGRTLEGLVGIAFSQGPEIEVPAAMDFIKTDTDGAGGGLDNQSHRVLEALMKQGRDGLLVDFPVSNEAISKAQQKRENIHAIIKDYKAKSIINWRLDDKQNLILVVLFETEEEPDGYGIDSIDQWRELVIGRLESEDDTASPRYVVKLWRKDTKGGADAFTLHREFEPKDAAGNPWDTIPFTFVGAIDNNSEIDKAPMLDLACLNIAHYRNSADYEESAYFMGQPWLAMSGLDESWVKAFFKDGTYVGSRAVTPLPQGAQPHMLQADPNTLAGEAMGKKETQMVAMGARLLTHGEAIKTAEQSRSETAAAHSVLSLAATNMALAYTQALEWVQMFTTGASGTVLYTMPVDYSGLNANPILVSSLIAGWQAGAIPTSDKNSALRQLGVINPDKDDETIATEIEAEGGGLELDE